jgi:AraC-like DNA-binding protein
MDAAAEQLGEAVGLRVAAEIPLGALGPVDYALTTSATLREGLHRLSRYYGVATERVELTVLEQPRAGLELTRNRAVTHSRHWIEFSLALITQRLRAAVGAAMALDEVWFLHPAPGAGARAEHEKFFAASVRFGCASDRLLFSPALLDVSLRTAAPLLATTLQTKLEEIDKDQGDPVLRRARKVIAESLGNTDVSIDVVAGRLAMSRRSFQRYLRDQGTSFRDLVDDIRRGRAEHLLEERKLSTVQIAKLLGFADTGAFFRAFRRWTGETPGGRIRPPKTTRPA